SKKHGREYGGKERRSGSSRSSIRHRVVVPGVGWRALSRTVVSSEARQELPTGLRRDALRAMRAIRSSTRPCATIFAFLCSMSTRCAGRAEILSQEIPSADNSTVGHGTPRAGHSHVSEAQTPGQTGLPERQERGGR